MSQFDIGGGASPDRISKGGIDLGTLPSGPTVALGAPGLAPLPAVSSGVALAQQLAQAVGVAGEAGDAANRYVLEARRIEWENREELRAQDRAHALKAWAESQADILQKIDSGAVRAIDGASLDDAARQIAAGQTKGMPPAFQEAYLDAAVPHIANRLRERQVRDQREAAADLHDRLAAGASGTSDPDVLRDFVAQGAKFKDVLGMTDDENAWGILGPAARAAAESGDQAKLDTINGIFGDRFKDKQVQLQNTLNSFENQQQLQAEHAATSAIDTAMLDQPIAVARDAVEGQRQALNQQFPGKNIGDTWALPHVAKLDAMDRGTAAQQRELEAEQQRQVEKDANNQVSSLILQGDTAGAMSKIGELAKSIPNGETWALGQISRVSEWDKKGDAENQRLIDQQFRQQQIQSAAGTLRAGGTVFSLPADGVTLERPGGREPLKVSHDELVQGGVSAVFAGIDDRARKQLADVSTGTGSDNPDYVARKSADITQQAFQQKAQFIADSGAPWPDATNALNSGATLPNLESLSRVDKAGKPVLNPATAAGYQLWQSLAGNPELQQRLASNPKARLFYETTDLAMSLVDDGNVQRAMMDAFKALSDPGSWKGTLADKIAPEKLDKASVGAMGAVGNPEFVRNEVHKLAQFAMSPAFGMGEAGALKWAVDRVSEHTINLNGYAVPRAGAPVPSVMPDAVKEIVREWVAANPNEGLTADDLTMRPGPNQTWILCRGENGVSVDNHLYPTSAIYKAYMQGIVHKQNESARQYKEGMETLGNMPEIKVPSGAKPAF